VNLVADEGVDRAVVERLRQDGHDVLYIAELSPGILDEEVLSYANARSAPIVTTDKDFGEMVFRQNLVSSGVVLLRLSGLANSTKAEIVAAICRQHGSELHGKFSVVTPGQFRIRWLRNP
jgi:predicted nuclease of predicted toxin-antitoxin system